MPTDRWHRLERIFTEAVEHSAHARDDFLNRACGVDRGMRDDIQSLLTAAEHSGDFLSAPALEMFARQIVREGWTVRPGDRIASYTVSRRLGAGAMGEVWRARDERLARDVAIKFLLPQASNVDRVRAFEHEARAAGTLNHPNVLTVYDVGEYHGAPFLVTECLEGESLRTRLGAGALPVDAALEIANHVARGLAAAHERDIVHRDLKPENIFLVRDGRVKILDFGLATLLDAAGETPASQESAVTVARSLVAGTAGYMAPEQVRGDTVDQRADIFALGAVLYEMLAGRPPFKGESTLATLDASLTLEPRDLADLNPAIPPPLARLVGRCLAKTADHRVTTIADLGTALDGVIRSRHPVPAPTLDAILRKPTVIVTLVLLVLATLAGIGLWRENTSRVRWARTVAAAEIQRLSNRGDFAEAFLLARQALDIVPDDPHLRQLWLNVSVPAVMRTDPADAEVAFASYRHPTTWFVLGRTPLDGVRIPRTLIRLRVSKAGFQTIEGSGAPGAMRRYRLDPVGAVPAGMVRVIAGRDPVRFGSIGNLQDFWIDRFEVTNREFKAFVDQGGYERRAYWQEPFVERGKSLRWEEAIARFRDTTGQRGPATWTSGSYAAGQADVPVGGVSWYEAAAYAAFVGKSLPTIYHWYRAADLGRFADILTVSNFTGKGPAPVGSFAGVGPFGTFDMAGNVKEWCWNAATNGRIILGGAWNEPRYLFADADAKDPFERAPTNGFRLAKYLGPVPTSVTAPVMMPTADRDARTRKPVGDDIFAVYTRQYAYDRTPLNAVIETTEEASLWFKQTVAFDAAYGGEWLRAYVFLPKTGLPSYQTVVFFPAADAFQLRSSCDMSLAAVEFIIRSGCAFLYPVYKGTYERQTREETGPNEERDLRIAWSRDLGRAIDYLETRSDIDRTRLAFYGVSAGADAGVTLAALEPRLKTCVLQGTGLANTEAPEIDPMNYAPRVLVPTLLLNGRYDFGVPVETSQRPLFALLGSAAEQKRHVIFQTGHALPIDDVAREILPWLDRYLGRVAYIPGERTSNGGGHE
jgi:serine/threonine protein kinase/dienelactone hydrolase